MKKVIFSIPSLNGGGAEKVMINIANSINMENFDVYMIVLDANGPYKKLVSKDIKLINLNTKKGSRSIFAFLREVNKIRPDILISTSEVMNILSLLLRQLFVSKPKVIIRLTNTPSKIIENFQGLNKILFSVLFKRLYPKADKIISQCNEMKEDFLKIYDIDTTKIQVIYNPLNLKMIQELKHGANPYNKNNVNFLAVGRLTYQKGFDILIQAFAEVKKVIPSAKLTILGNGEEYKQLLNLTKELNLNESIQIVDFVDNPFVYYNYCDLFVLPSRWEGFPNALLEALACNSKAISTNCPSGPTEIIGITNKFGKLVEVENITTLAEAMVGEIEEPNKSGERASDFDITKITQEYITLFDNL